MEDKLHPKGTFWNMIQSIQFDYSGYILVASFLTTWLISALIWKSGKVEQHWP